MFAKYRIFFVFVVALLAIFLTACGSSQAEISASPTPTSGISQADSNELECRTYSTTTNDEFVSFYGGEEVQAKTNQLFAITIAWVADTVELVNDYIESVDFQLLINGNPVDTSNALWNSVTQWGDEDSDGDMDWRANWICVLDDLIPGTYSISANIVYSFTVTDGFDLDNDGQDDQFSGIINLHPFEIAPE